MENGRLEIGEQVSKERLAGMNLTIQKHVTANLCIVYGPGMNDAYMCNVSDMGEGYRCLGRV